MSDLFVAKKYEVCARSLLAAMKRHTQSYDTYMTDIPVCPTTSMFL